MHQLSTICFTLMVVSVLVQSANGKRGCAAFGHACYGGHGKRSPASGSPGYADGLDPSMMALEMLPIPYSKLIVDKPRSMDPTAEGVRSNDAYGVDAALLRPRVVDSKARDLKYAIYAMLRQLMEESAANRQEHTHISQPLPGHQQPSFPRDLSPVVDVERK